MAANELTFNQVATLLNSIQLMVTGQSSEIVTEGDFATVATTVLKSGYEQVYNAISTVLGRTIFSIRPYTRKFKGLERTDGEFKMHTRKLQIADADFEENNTVKYPVHVDANEDPASGDGLSVDQQIIKKSKILQTNFYGMNTYQDHYTIFDEQLDVAFSSSAELGRFFSMIIMNINNRFEQAREDFARMNLVNYIAAQCVAVGGTHRINLFSQYRTETGINLNINNVRAPEYYAPFMRWAYAYIKRIRQMFTERSVYAQQNIEGYPILRHTPLEDQRLFILSDYKYDFDSIVLSTTYNDEYLNPEYTEAVTFWQNPGNPGRVIFKPTYTGTNGAVINSTSLVNASAVFAVLMDKEALGYSVVKSTMKAAPYNARADYRNFFLKDYHKSFMDLSEKGIVFTLGTVEITDQSTPSS